MWGKFDSGTIKPEDLTARALDARGPVAVYCLKRDLMLHAMNIEFDRIGMGLSTKAVFKAVLGVIRVVPPSVEPPSAAA